MFDRLLDFVIGAVRAEEQTKRQKEREIEDLTRPVAKEGFWIDIKAASIVEPARKKAAHHREREKHYTKQLEIAEKELREKGISIEVYDQTTGTYQNYGAITSGSIASGQIGSFNVGGGTANITQQVFQPRVDQKLLDPVKNATTKMLDHRKRADDYERYARAFSLAPERLIRLGIADVHYFGLGEEKA